MAIHDDLSLKKSIITNYYRRAMIGLNNYWSLPYNCHC